MATEPTNAFQEEEEDDQIMQQVLGTDIGQALFWLNFLKTFKCGLLKNILI